MSVNGGYLKLVLLALFSLLLLAACQPKKPPEVKPEEAKVEEVKKWAFSPVPEISSQIQSLMARGRAGEEPVLILAEFDRLIGQAEPPLREEATFRKAQYMLENQLMGAEQAMAQIIAVYPENSLVPYAHFWLAQWWIGLDEASRALASMRLALTHERLTRELADEILTAGSAIVQEVPEREAVYWLLAAAQIDADRRSNWLRMAARRTSLETLEQLHAEAALTAEMAPAFDLHVGRTYLMRGDIASVGRIAELLAQLAPDSPEVAQLQGWASGAIRAVTIGVLLPLTGPYASYGQDALRGIRIALAGLETNSYITLRVEDTASDVVTAVDAYERLASESVNIIIGPLLAETTEALLPYMKESLPVISLTGRADLAEQSPALFVHTLSPLAQVGVIAEYAWLQGVERMVVISEDEQGLGEGQAFMAAFEELGGEVTHTLHLNRQLLDHRHELRELRFDTDDDALLSLLDEELALFLPTTEMEIRMPVNFDAVYLAMNGKQVSLLAGQLAYADIHGVPLYGSSRWQDGHLLDDRGRYLSEGRFVGSAATGMNESLEDPARNQLRFIYREAWGSGNPSELAALAYDTMRIAAVMTSRLGLAEDDIVIGLQDAEGFPAVTGHVRFDQFGVGQKQLDIFSIQSGRVVPAG